MRIVVFLASLFLMLLGGRLEAFAGINPDNNYTASAAGYHIDQKKLVNFDAEATHTSIQNTTVPEENKIYICEDAEEEDDNQSSRKYQPVSAFFSGFSYQSPFAFLDNCFEATPFSYLQASPRYIFQRALRI